MIKFIKNLFGFGSADSNTPKETVKEILTPPAKAEVPTAGYISPAKPVTKVRAITDTNPNAVKAAVAPKPANKKRRPYRDNKVKAGGTVAKVTEGKAKGGNGAVKPAQVAKVKPQAPKAPVAKKK
jgi:hypothetical protein